MKRGRSWACTLYNRRHLSEAKEAAQVEGGYFWHFRLAISEAGGIYFELYGEKENSNRQQDCLKVVNNTFSNIDLSPRAPVLLITLGSIVHAFIPWVLDFKLLEWRIARLKLLKQKLPNDPQLKKVHFDE